MAATTENEPSLGLRFHVLVGAAGGARIVVRVVLPSPVLSLFSPLLDLRLHLDLDLPALHVHILRLRFGMDRVGEGGSSGFLRSGLALWALLFLHTQVPIRRLRGPCTASQTYVLVGAVHISSSGFRPLAVARL